MEKKVFYYINNTPHSKMFEDYYETERGFYFLNNKGDVILFLPITILFEINYYIKK